jgi:thymidylate synthase
MSTIDFEFKNLIARILNEGDEHSDRTGTGTLSVFNHSITLNVSENFPMLTLKQVYFSGVVDELLWFISGSTNVNDLPKRTQKWWRPWAEENGALGPTYGKQYKDQLDNLIEGLKTNPNSRRHVMTMWNGVDVKNCNLPPCHGTVIQFYVKDNKLSLSTYQRSCDTLIGYPVNVASYSLLLYMIAHICGYEPYKLHYTTGDTHIYLDHLEAANASK